jgi:hypothetical protein
MRIIVDTFISIGDTNQLQQFNGSSMRLLFCHTEVPFERFLQLVSNGKNRIK